MKEDNIASKDNFTKMCYILAHMLAHMWAQGYPEEGTQANPRVQGRPPGGQDIWNVSQRMSKKVFQLGEPDKIQNTELNLNFTQTKNFGHKF